MKAILYNDGLDKFEIKELTKEEMDELKDTGDLEDYENYAFLSQDTEKQIVESVNKNLNRFCCNVPMIELKNWDYLSDGTITDGKKFFCGECGQMREELEICEDDEVIENILEHYEDELKDTKIYKEMKG